MRQIALMGLMAAALAVGLHGCGAGAGGNGDAGLADAGNALTCDGKNDGDPCGNGGLCFKNCGGLCDADVGMSCFPPCSSDGSPCESSCYPYDGGFHCLPTCSKPAGSSCDECNPCVAGAQCLEYEGNNTCFTICTDASTCNAGEECFDTSLGFKVCIAPTQDGGR